MSAPEMPMRVSARVTSASSDGVVRIHHGFPGLPAARRMCVSKGAQRPPPRRRSAAR